MKVKIVGEILVARKKAGLTQTELENLTGIKQTLFVTKYDTKVCHEIDVYVYFIYR